MMMRQPPAPGGGQSNLQVITQTLQVATSGEGEMHDLTADISRLLSNTEIQEGQVTIFVPGSTASVTTIEFEPGLKEDFPAAMEKIAPKDADYAHDRTWHDGNGHSHVRASLVGPSLTLPVHQGRLMVGTWQQVVLIDWDNRPRRREIVFQFMGIG